ncbi:MAG: selenocysteine-specific translation elongation factor [Lachnospiraceae bacterium]|nr:selenocysteine-specific translation elongation factor [Lachnospiraceae bacterium]
MQNIIIGTAGHVDHGKTFLIKALTGFDTDRLKEEKKRGITIENGFANLPNDLGLHLGIIDVPGHEKFVKNMLAGIGGIDLVLLVISLEEGIKPQTIEHFEIIKSLGIKKGIIVFTKLDSENIVDFDTLKSQVKDLVKGSNLENAKIIPVSSLTGKNIDVLKEEIFSLVKEIGERNSNKELTRLPIDRVFTMEGFGTVITGTLMEGKIDTGDELMVYPSQKIVKVRQIQSHGSVEPSALAGQRTAINLLNVKKEELNRGDVLATKSSIILSEMIDCKVTMFKSAKRKLKNGERVHFNYGSKQTEANVKVISDEYVQFKFESPIPIKRDDKYIIRFISPAETCGGGIVLNIATKRYKMEDGIALNHFKALDGNDDKSILLEMINDSSVDFPDPVFLSKKMNQGLKDIKEILKQLLGTDSIEVINPTRSKNEEINDNAIILSHKFYEGAKKYILDILNKYHRENPISKGLKKEELKSILFKRYNKVGDTKLEDLLNYMIGKNVLKQIDDLISSFEFDAVLDDKKSKEKIAIEKKYLDASYNVPLTQDVVTEFSTIKDGKNNKLEIRQMIVDLAKEGKLIKLSNDYYIHKDNFDKVLAVVDKLFENSDRITMTELRDKLETSRKYAILIIDYLDQKRITKLAGEYRMKGDRYGKV